MINAKEIIAVHIAFMFVKPTKFDKVDAQYWLKREFNLVDNFNSITLPDDIPVDVSATIPVVTYSDKRHVINVSGLRYDTVYNITDLDVIACHKFISDKLVKHAKVALECFKGYGFRPGIVITANIQESHTEMYEKLVNSKVINESSELLLAWNRSEEHAGVLYNGWTRLNYNNEPNIKQFIVDYNTKAPIDCLEITDIQNALTSVSDLAFKFIVEGKIDEYAE